jgi:ABC-type iron transport system FetAB permease component
LLAWIAAVASVAFDLAASSISLSPAQDFPYRRGMQKLSKLFVAVFTTKFLASIVCFLAGVLLMKGLSYYYDFNWINALAAE